jgi:hypothetical protein
MLGSELGPTARQTMTSQSAKGLGSGSVIAAALADVCFREQRGKHLLALSFSVFDPGRVETFFIPQ